MTLWFLYSLPSGPIITKRHSPPGFGSKTWKSFVNPFGPHQRSILSRSTYAAKTSFRGASMSRVEETVWSLEASRSLFVFKEGLHFDNAPEGLSSIAWGRPLRPCPRYGFNR